MMRCTWVVVAAVLALAGCDDRRQRVEQAITSGLKDPDSARFGKEMTLYGPPESLLACGTLNARNGFGGYVGDMPFMVWNGYLFMATDANAAAVADCCNRVHTESKATPGGALSPATAAVCAQRGEGVPFGI